MSETQTKTKHAWVIGMFVLLLAGLAVIGLACPVSKLRWDFWVLLAVVVVGLLASLVVVLFRESIFPPKEG